MSSNESYPTKTYLMYKLLSIAYFILFSCSLSKPNQAYSQSELDTAFVNWNKATLVSLERQLQSSADSMQKALYENRLLTIKGYWDIENIEAVNNKSIRYELLKTVFVNLGNKQNGLYIVEANESGSKVLLRSYVLHRNANNEGEVEFYDFINGGWKITGKFKLDNLYLQADLKGYISPFGKGFNDEDVVITEFENGRLKESEYYLYSTLSMESKIKNVLDGYRKENFIK